MDLGQVVAQIDLESIVWVYASLLPQISFAPQLTGVPAACCDPDFTAAATAATALGCGSSAFSRARPRP